MKTVALLALTLASSGCFRYVPTQLETTPPGEGVRVLVTRQGAEELSTITEVDFNRPVVNGTVVGVEGTDLLVQVPVARRQDGFITGNLNQTVRVPTGEILSFERRELDKLATGLLLGGGVGIAAAIVGFIVKPFGRKEPGNNDPPDDLLLERGRFSIPIGSIPIGE